MKQSEIAAVIERDLLRVDARPPSNTVQCFSCGYGMTYRGSRFCSDRCREWFDASNPGLAQDWLERKRAAWRVIAGPPGIVGTEHYNPDLRSTKAGCPIDCAHCGEEFDSKGLRCCSKDCEHSYRERQDNLAVSESRPHQSGNARTAGRLFPNGATAGECAVTSVSVRQNVVPGVRQPKPPK